MTSPVRGPAAYLTTLQLSPAAVSHMGIRSDATWGLLDSTMVLAY